MNQIKLGGTALLWFYSTPYEDYSPDNFAERVVNLFCLRIWRPMWGRARSSKRESRSDVTSQSASLLVSTRLFSLFPVDAHPIKMHSLVYHKYEYIADYVGSGNILLSQ